MGYEQKLLQVVSSLQSGLSALHLALGSLRKRTFTSGSANWKE